MQSIRRYSACGVSRRHTKHRLNLTVCIVSNKRTILYMCNLSMSNIAELAWIRGLHTYWHVTRARAALWGERATRRKNTLSETRRVNLGHGWSTSRPCSMPPKKRAQAPPDCCRRARSGAVLR